MDKMPTESVAYEIVQAYRAQTINKASAIERLIALYSPGGMTAAGAELLLDDWDGIEKWIRYTSKLKQELLMEPPEAWKVGE